jgi:hypothetical protein
MKGVRESAIAVCVLSLLSVPARAQSPRTVGPVQRNRLGSGILRIRL